jgi:hypothetical protein
MNEVENYTRSLAQIVVMKQKFHLNQTDPGLYIAENVIEKEDLKGIKILTS